MKVAVSRAVCLLSVSVRRVSNVYADAADKSNRSLLYDNHEGNREEKVIRRDKVF